MVELLEGRLGAGKTYSAAVRIVAHLAQGGTVCTNVELVWPELRAYVAERYGVHVEDSQFLTLSEDQVRLFHRFTPSGTPEMPVLVVIDEAHLYFNSRDFAQTDKLYRETLTFLTQSRKVHTDVVFISQSVLNMDKQFMRLVQFIWRFRDLEKWTMPGLGVRWPIKQLLAVQYDYDGKTIMSRSFIRKDRRIFSLYRTNSLLKEFPRLEGIQTKRTLKRVEKEKGMVVKVLIPLAIVVGVIAFWLIGRNFRKPDAPIATSAGKSVMTKVTSVAQDHAKGVLPGTSSDQGAYDIYAEHFAAWNEPARSLQTHEGGWYQLGEMSPHGFVTAVSARRAKVATPAGRTAWVIAGEYPGENKTVAGAPSPSPSPGSIVVAEDSRRKAWQESHSLPSASPTSTPVLAPAYHNGLPVGLNVVPNVQPEK
ncbi:MAG TPA: zonular occludens toxin domain-containing protein [Chthoniobacterales bacterium]|jgi:hypothetical protein